MPEIKQYKQLLVFYFVCLSAMIYLYLNYTIENGFGFGIIASILLIGIFAAIISLSRPKSAANE